MKDRPTREDADAILEYVERGQGSEGSEILAAEVRALREELALAQAGAAEMREELRHDVPGGCWATGPLTGDPILDLVVCPGCEALSSDAGKAMLERVERLEKFVEAVANGAGSEQAMSTQLILIRRGAESALREDATKEGR